LFLLAVFIAAVAAAAVFAFAAFFSVSRARRAVINISRSF